MARKPAAGTRERILDAAVHLFDQRGVHAVGMGLVRAMALNARGCPLRNTQAEFPDPDHPAHQVSVKHFRRVREQLRGLARRTPAAKPERLGDRIMLIIDGVCERVDPGFDRCRGGGRRVRQRRGPGGDRRRGRLIPVR
ncbi:hypothetical protein [Streptomyces sp. NPDC001020]